jgi:RNA polymerase sigma-70 factor (ECF subfamily)
MRDITLSELLRLQPRAIEADEALQMDQDTFRAFYERTARPVWVYLWRRTGDGQLADDLLQETYYRFLRAPAKYESEAHRRNYLFKIATNLAHDSWRNREDAMHLPEEGEAGAPAYDPRLAEQSQRRADLTRAMARLSARQRDALWLAYAEGSSHEEIAEILGLKARSIKILLFRARRKLASLLRGEGARRRTGSSK